MAESASVIISVRVESDFKKSIDSFAEKYHNGNRNECVITAIKRYLDASNQEIACIPNGVLSKIKFVRHLIRTGDLINEKTLIETEVTELWEMIEK